MTKGMHMCPEEIVGTTLKDLLGTNVAADVPIWHAGIDSVSATEFTHQLSERVGALLPSTLVFDYPTIKSISNFLALSVTTKLGPTSSEETLKVLDPPRHVSKTQEPEYE